MRAHYHIKDLIFFVRQRSSDIPILREVIQSETYFQGILMVDPNDVVVDIGAHIGSFSIYAASKGAAVIAYEPTTINFTLLKDNIEINGFPVTSYKQAVTAKPGMQTIYIRPFNFGGTSFFNTPTPDPKYREDVECITLAEVFTTNHLAKIDFLKLDCEHSELEILTAHQELLPKINKIAIEWMGGERRKALRDFLSPAYNITEFGEDPMGIMLARRKT